MRRAAAVLAALALPIALLVSVTASSANGASTSTRFVDVPTSHVFGTEIGWLDDRGITTGYADGTFRPSAPVLREQMAAFLYRLEGSPAFTAPATSPFPDVPTTHVFYREIAWLASTRITTGYADGTFRPSAPVLREQMAAFLYRLEGEPAVDVPVRSPFVDVPTTHVFYRPMAWLSAEAITTGYADGTFRPSEPVLREQMAAFLYRLEDGGPEPPVDPVPGIFETVTPVVTGSAAVGGTLSVAVTGWTPAPTSTSVTWLRDGAPITGATGRAYTVAVADRGTSISARVTGSRSGYTSATVTSDPVAVPPIPAVRSVSGTIAADTVWSPDDARVVRVTGDVVVPAGVTLTLRPGTIVKVQPGAALQVQGTVRVEGSPAAPVVMTSIRDDTVGGDTNGDGSATAPAAGDWAGVSATSRGTITMANAVLRDAGTAVSATGDATAAPTLALTSTAISRSTWCVVARGPVTGSFTGSVRDCGAGVSADYAFDARGVDWGSASGPSPYGSGVAVEGVTVTVAPWTGYTAPSRPLVAAPQQTPRRTECQDVALVGVRGSGEDPESPDPQTYGEFPYDESGFGSYNYVVAAEFLQRLAEERPGTSVKLLAVQYLALQIPAYDEDISYVRFLDSVFDGVDKLVQLLADESARCPSTQFVLLGTSQGALVVHLALESLTGPGQQARIASVMLLADPARVAGSPETLWETSGVPARAELREASGGWTDFYPGFDQPIPRWVASRTISMCHSGDVFCAFAPGATLYPHLAYTTEELQALAGWLAPTVAARLPE